MYSFYVGEQESRRDYGTAISGIVILLKGIHLNHSQAFLPIGDEAMSKNARSLEMSQRASILARWLISKL